MRPIRDLGRALTMPLKALFVVALCAVINLLASPGHWWVQWVALGMGIATVVALARGLRSALALGLLALAGAWLLRRLRGGAQRPAASSQARS